MTRPQKQTTGVFSNFFTRDVSSAQRSNGKFQRTNSNGHKANVGIRRRNYQNENKFILYNKISRKVTSKELR